MKIKIDGIFEREVVNIPRPEDYYLKAEMIFMRAFDDLIINKMERLREREEIGQVSLIDKKPSMV